MTTTVAITALTSCDVSSDGEHIRFGVRDSTGKPVNLFISAEQAGSLAMTLPKLLSTALKARFRDPSLRLVFPLSDYFIEGTGDAEKIILSLKTPDGFEVSFAMSPGTLSEFGQLVNTQTERPRFN